MVPTTLAKSSCGSRSVQKRPAHRGPRTVAGAVVAAVFDVTFTSPAIRTSTPRTRGSTVPSSAASASSVAGCSIQITASCAVASVDPCAIFTPPVRCQTSYTPSDHRAACVALMASGSAGFIDGTSMRPASAIAAASPRAGNVASAPALASGVTIVSAARTSEPHQLVRQATVTTSNRAQPRPRPAGMRGPRGGGAVVMRG